MNIFTTHNINPISFAHQASATAHLLSLTAQITRNTTSERITSNEKMMTGHNSNNLLRKRYPTSNNARLVTQKKIHVRIVSVIQIEMAATTQ